MNRQTALFILLCLGVGGFCALHFPQWVKTEPIEIRYRSGPARGMRGGGGASVVFSLAGEYKLTMIKVCSVEEARTNKYPFAYWQLVGAPRSTPTMVFGYGDGLRGMKPRSPNRPVEKLVPGVAYRIVVEAGRRRGEATFTPSSAPGARR